VARNSVKFKDTINNVDEYEDQNTQVESPEKRKKVIKNLGPEPDGNQDFFMSKNPSGMEFPKVNNEYTDLAAEIEEEEDPIRFNSILKGRNREES